MRRPTVFIALAALAALLASMVVYSSLKKRDAAVQEAMAKTTHIVVAATDIPLGSKIDAGQVKMVRWSADSIPEGSYTNPGQIIGAFVKTQFVTGEPIVASRLFLGQKTAGVLPLLIPPGMRAVSVPVDEVSDVAGFVLPHTHVDILVSLQASGGGKPLAKIVLQNVEVLAIAQEVEKKKDEPESVKVVTLLVTPQEAERLALASREGSLRLAMRNYTDNKIVLTTGSDVDQLLHSYSEPEPPPVMPAQAHPAPAPRPVHQFDIEIMRDGKTSESVTFVSEAMADDASPRKRHGENVSAIDDSFKPLKNNPNPDSGSSGAPSGSANPPPSAPPQPSTSNSPTAQDTTNQGSGAISVPTAPPDAGRVAEITIPSADGKADAALDGRSKSKVPQTTVVSEEAAKVADSRSYGADSNKPTAPISKTETPAASNSAGFVGGDSPIIKASDSENSKPAPKTIEVPDEGEDTSASHADAGGAVAK
ncbi:MAG TPA: Flp pilus assembly protein CpaB [Candidatus Binataceae bacterium]|nr:Flp pilus assembly protein CpaB [Candidatus Binataceae bacterium]